MVLDGTCTAEVTKNDNSQCSFDFVAQRVIWVTLGNCSLTWNKWKKAKIDYVVRIEEMLARTKLVSETMTKNYHDKKFLGKESKIYGEDVISSFINGVST